MLLQGATHPSTVLYREIPKVCAVFANCACAWLLSSNLLGRFPRRRRAHHRHGATLSPRHTVTHARRSACGGGPRLQRASGRTRARGADSSFLHNHIIDICTRRGGCAPKQYGRTEYDHAPGRECGGRRARRLARGAGGAAASGTGRRFRRISPAHTSEEEVRGQKERLNLEESNEESTGLGAAPVSEQVRQSK